LHQFTPTSVSSKTETETSATLKQNDPEAEATACSPIQCINIEPYEDISDTEDEVFLPNPSTGAQDEQIPSMLLPEGQPPIICGMHTPALDTCVALIPLIDIGSHNKSLNLEHKNFLTTDFPQTPTLG
jgi:hypothetical protein